MSTHASRHLRDLLQVRPGTAVDLAAIDPRATPGLPGGQHRPRHPKRWAGAELARLGPQLASLQERLFARAKVGESTQRVLLVLQAMDCGGKDGTTKQVARMMNPQGLSVVAFGRPTAEEQAHEFLWRITRALPTAGYVGVFNRSQYEDVLVVRVHELVPEPVWRARYDEINSFEADLAAGGVTIVKVMLHISYAEQARRLAQRLDDPTKHWKYSPGDLAERDRWTDYQDAYAEALARCSTAAAPWYVVPADRKWYRNWAVTVLLHETMGDLGLVYPTGDFDVDAERRRLRASRGAVVTGAAAT